MSIKPCQASLYLALTTARAASLVHGSASNAARRSPFSRSAPLIAPLPNEASAVIVAYTACAPGGTNCTHPTGRQHNAGVYLERASCRAAYRVWSATGSSSARCAKGDRGLVVQASSEVGDSAGKPEALSSLCLLPLLGNLGSIGRRSHHSWQQDGRGSFGLGNSRRGRQNQAGAGREIERLTFAFAWFTASRADSALRT